MAEVGDREPDVHGEPPVWVEAGTECGAGNALQG